MTDFRALCGEILQLLDYYIPEDDRPTCWDPWRQRARAALTEGPTVVSDEDLLDLHDWMTDEWAANHDFELPPSQYARAVLARWGNHVIATKLKNHG